MLVLPHGVAVAVLMAALLAIGCATLTQMNPFVFRVKVGKPFIVAKSTDHVGWGTITHPFLFDLADDFLFMYAPGEGGPAATCVSTNRGASWQVYNMAEQGPTQGVMCAVRRNDGGVALFGWFWPDRIACARHDLAGAVSWTNPQPTRFEVPDYTGWWPSPRGVEDKNGDQLLVAYAPWPEQSNMFCTILLRSDDQGATFRTAGVIATPRDTPWGGEGPCETAVTVLPDGEILCIMRTGSVGNWDPGGLGRMKPMLAARSRDGGQTWARHWTPLDGAMPKLVQMSNGVLACAFGRPGNHIVFSLDNGRSWGRGVQLGRADVPTTGYCDITEVSPGRLLAVYDGIDVPLSRFWLWEPPERGNAVFGVFIDIERK